MDWQLTFEKFVSWRGCSIEFVETTRAMEIGEHMMEFLLLPQVSKMHFTQQAQVVPNYRWKEMQ